MVSASEPMDVAVDGLDAGVYDVGGACGTGDVVGGSAGARATTGGVASAGGGNGDEGDEYGDGDDVANRAAIGGRGDKSDGDVVVLTVSQLDVVDAADKGPALYEKSDGTDNSVPEDEGNGASGVKARVGIGGITSVDGFVGLDFRRKNPGADVPVPSPLSDLCGCGLLRDHLLVSDFVLGRAGPEASERYAPSLTAPSAS